MRTPEEVADEMAVFQYGRNCRNPNDKRNGRTTALGAVRSRDAEIAKELRENWKKYVDGEITSIDFWEWYDKFIEELEGERK